MPQKLNVFLNQIHIGELTQNKKNQLAFTYAPSWLQNERAFSFSLPFLLREEPYVGKDVYAYFDNLLPDNMSIRRKIALQTKAESSEVFDLLAQVGKDCIGALQFILDAEEPPQLKEPEGISVTEKDILNIVKNLEFFPLGMSSSEDFRLSLAGMQEKTALLKYKNKWWRPLHSTPTTHILKPMMNPDKMQIPLTHSVENEWLCAQIIEGFGLPVAKTEIIEIEKNKILVVERFDRLWRQDHLIRLPQEDFCQALAISSDKKYEVDGGPGIKSIMNILDTSKNRDQDRKNFIKAQILFWAMAAIDGHAKNFSLFHSPEGYHLTPLYDVLSAAPVLETKKMAYQDLKVAMCVGDKRRYKISEIQKRHWLQTAKICHYSTEEVELLMHEIVNEVDAVIAKVQQKIPRGFPGIVCDSIFNFLQQRIKVLL